MKAKNIKSVLRRKTDAWIASIENESLRETVKANAIVTGGSLASMLMGEKVNDYDIYFKTYGATIAVAKYYVEKFKANPPTRFKDCSSIENIAVDGRDGRIKVVVKSAGIAGESGADNYQYFEQVDQQEAAHDYVEQVASDVEDSKESKAKPAYRPVFVTSNAITLSDQIQIVIRFYGAVNEIHANYDFIHCTCSWDCATGELILPPAALESMLTKCLKYKTSKYPLCSFIRTRKFLGRGWKCDAGQYVKMAFDLNKFDLTNPEILEDQMVGVDAAYFYQVIEMLKKKCPGKIEDTYLIEIIDKVF